ncbi:MULTISPECIES: helix-turn-helix transcriptional regulator [Tatumella]|uniref:Helix-turn-helix transcriptional regulator n=1 Tax=Tatumella punctata TaxID=399969 RepID=A0ABW1VKB6_9GAMM|nr:MULTISPECIES: helix-turn-helix transcriptional regulator [unclassified Tatumella]MBS0856235.1 helix-turn-helix transcriptional regulator [Tatumella sp. JGM16]MBS0877589.1 helix-turn-helix transcriptional regulator [Tatumella sp. JGM82]MBS0891058.1 helix-turn-helix transcriptional regulator [Tatumella sp. JGM94]MBS0902121.1 helix-turn-helix transcriptional regulator [Tatumella sp. JGM100]MBS0913214.1 helix-turn-helix transcriptional regulator [Tatumella sp. JGM91]
MNSLSSEINQRSFLVADFREFGSRYGIDYRFPGGDDTTELVRGRVEEWRLSSGMSVTHSDLQILHPYESTSAGSSPLYMLVVLEGHVDLQLNGQPVSLSAGRVLSTPLGKTSVLSARHHKDQRLITLSLGFSPVSSPPQSPLARVLKSGPRTGTPFTVWHLPDSLLASMRFAIGYQSTAAARELMLEGLMLQLLGTMITPPDWQQNTRTLPGERHRLEVVRQLLASSPEKNHSLESLAKTAAMSSSSLRTKFRQAYGDSVFNYLRDCRLALARRYLQQGYSVQQAAWMSGYQHATNFSTAFRRRYGISPSHLCSSPASRI